MCSILWLKKNKKKKTRGTRRFAVVASVGVIDGVQSGGFAAWPGAAAIWTPYGSGSRPPALLLVLTLRVNRPTGRLKRKFVFALVFGRRFGAGKFFPDGKQVLFPC